MERLIKFDGTLDSWFRWYGPKACHWAVWKVIKQGKYIHPSQWNFWEKENYSKQNYQLFINKKTFELKSLCLLWLVKFVNSLQQKSQQHQQTINAHWKSIGKIQREIVYEKVFSCLSWKNEKFPFSIKPNNHLKLRRIVSHWKIE